LQNTSNNVLLVFMSKLSRKFQVPDQLAHLYDFANSLDVRHFTHHGVPHVQNDELTAPRELAAWLAERKLLTPGTSKITPSMFDAALRLRADLRSYLGCDPVERRRNGRVAGHLNNALKMFPLVAEARGGEALTLRASRNDALAGLSAVVAELYNGSLNGTLDRLKMCAAEECRRVFFDRSKPATRRWCMSALCGNRMKTRTYRARHRDAG
jgi:predicted RNA-binding Zn ribbon-like protein